MVKIVTKHIRETDNQLEIDLWLESVSKFYENSRLKTIKKALNILKHYIQEHKNISFSSSLDIATILFDLEADEEAVSAGLLLNLFQKDIIKYDYIHEIFGQNIADILKGLGVINNTRLLQNNENEMQIDTFRKMLLSIVKDVRIVLVKLSEQLFLLRNSKNIAVIERENLSKEILKIYAPLASRLGISSMKWEMEDRAFLNLNPVEYKNIVNLLGEKRVSRESAIADDVKEVQEVLKNNFIKHDISFRVKHIYSIYKKMLKKNMDYKRLFDVKAIRILVDNIDDCYKSLSCVNDLWKSIPKEFSDYIATPKQNGYQSVHGVYFDSNSQIVEVQIRTHKMHQESEMGVAAHWRYKEGGKHDSSYESRIIWLRSLIDWKNEVSNSSNLEVDLENRVYAFTPSGDVQDLPEGSTSLDFAYHIHTMIGHRCRGAKINGKIMPLTTILQTGDKVEILTQKQPLPNKSWALEKAKYIFSSKIRSKISRWFKQDVLLENSSLGKDKLLEKVAGISNLKKINYLEVAKAFNMKDKDNFFASIETKNIKIQPVLNYISVHFKDTKQNINNIDDISTFETNHNNISQNDLTFHGINNLLSNLANCCHPILGDDIMGYITQGKGITIHRNGCKTLNHLLKNQPNRKILVKWGVKDEKKYNINLLITIENNSKSQQNLFNYLSANKITVSHYNIAFNKRTQNDKLINITIKTASVNDLTILIAGISSIPQVLKVTRNSI